MKEVCAWLSLCSPRCVTGGQSASCREPQACLVLALVYDENQWANEREEAYTTLVLPNDADRVLDKLR